MAIDHVGFAVADFAASRGFYTAALAPLGIGMVAEGEGWAMLGRDGKGSFWFGSYGTPPGRIHLAFAARSLVEVDAFHAAALAADGQDNGAPGLRPQYRLNYYGAFIMDLNGHNIEAVCHAAG